MQSMCGGGKSGRDGPLVEEAEQWAMAGGGVDGAVME